MDINKVVLTTTALFIAMLIASVAAIAYSALILQSNQVNIMISGTLALTVNGSSTNRTMYGGQSFLLRTQLSEVDLSQTWQVTFRMNTTVIATETANTAGVATYTYSPTVSSGDLLQFSATATGGA